MKTLLHLGTPEDSDYQYRLAGLTAGKQVAWKSKLSTPATIRDLEDTLAKLPKPVDGIVCSNEEFLDRLLNAQPDFLPPNNRRGITLDDYQGSMLFTPRDKIPVVFINPLMNLVTTTTAVPAAKRFISKLTSPEDFFTPTEFTWVLATPTNLPEYLARWEKLAAIISIDIETPDNRDHDANPNRTINCVGYCAYFPATHTTECLVIPFDSTFNLEYVRLFNNLPQPKVMQNGLYDSVYFMRFGAPVFNWLYDTQHLFHSMYSEYPKRLDFITAYAIRVVRYWKDDGKSGNITDYYRYNAKDCWATLNSLLALVLLADSYAIKNYLKEFSLVFPCLHCELEGSAIDMPRMAVVKALKEQEVLMQEKSLLTCLAAPNFNVNSPKQVKDLFTVLGVGHLPDTAKASMLKAQASHPLNNRILSQLVELKQAKKLLSTYFVEGKFWNGRLYYKLNPAGTDTGRLASSESSYWCGLQIQNIPRGDSVKQCIVSDPGWLLCEIDKAQSEARCVAYLSGDTALLALVESVHDYHSWNASAFFGVPYEQIYDEVKKKVLNKILRDLAKRTNHGANYNMGARVMLDTMGPKYVAFAKLTLRLPANWSLLQVCTHLLEVYERTYPRVKGLLYDEIIKEVSLTGRLVSPRGWTRIFFGKPSRSNKPALNAAVAHPGQNLSVDIINEEFYNVWRAQMYNFYYKDGVRVDAPLRDIIRVKAQIHDSILFQYRKEHPDAPELVNNIMRTVVRIVGADKVTRDMFIPSEISAGKERWSELK